VSTGFWKCPPPKKNIEFPRQVFILNSNHPGQTTTDLQQDAIIEVLRQAFPNSVPTIEYMDLKREPEGDHLRQMRSLLRSQYKDKKYAAIITIGAAALDFAYQNRREIFNDSPLIFCATRSFQPVMTKGNMTGAIVNEGLHSAVDTMLKVKKNIKEVFVLNDESLTGLGLRRQLDEVITHYQNKVRFKYLPHLALEDLYKEVEKIPPDSCLLMLSFTNDLLGRTYDQQEVAKLISRHCKVPIFDHSIVRLGYGILGGGLADPTGQAATAARMAVRIVNGEDVNRIPIAYLRGSKNMFDYAQMERFNIPVSALPANSVVINKPKPFYEIHKTVILASLAIILVLVLAIWMLLINISKRRTLEDNLSETKEILEKIFASVKSAYFINDAEKRTIVNCNPAALIMFGYEREEMIGLNMGFLFPSTELHREFSEKMYAALTEHGAFRYDYSMKTKEGKIFPVNHSITQVLDKSGKRTHLVSVIYDLTERKNAEEQQRQQWEQLEHNNRLAAIGEVASSIAHELNQPLTAILSNAQAGRRFLSLDPPAIHEIQNILEDIVRDNKRAGVVMGNLRNFTKAKPARLESFHINDSIRNVLSLLNSETIHNNTVVTLDLEPELGLLQGDCMGVQQVLINLILNAFDSMQEVHPSERRLLIRSAAESDQVIVSVKDCGVGIKEEDRETIFDAFYTTKHDGLGLGLSISKRIVNSHGGMLRAVNNPDKGATFHLTLCIGSKGSDNYAD